MKTQSIVSKFKITNDEEYESAKETFDKFLQEAKSIVDFLSGPKNNENIVLVKDETINSDYLNNLRTNMDDLEASLWDYNNKPINKNISIGEGLHTDIGKYLRMYESYLKDRKNPENLNMIELKNIEYIPNPPYYITSSKKNFGIWGKLFGIK